eukprot:scaffold1525_cov23-Tisochrysis_lutea.AAC.1
MKGARQERYQPELTQQQEAPSAACFHHAQAGRCFHQAAACFHWPAGQSQGAGPPGERWRAG